MNPLDKKTIAASEVIFRGFAVSMLVCAVTIAAGAQQAGTFAAAPASGTEVEKNSNRNRKGAVPLPSRTPKGRKPEVGPSSGEITIVTDPSGLEVFIDGKSYGPSPIQAVISAGEHAYKITPPPGALPGGGTFVLKDGAVIRKTVSWTREGVNPASYSPAQAPKIQQAEQPPSSAISPSDKQSAGAAASGRAEAQKTEKIEQSQGVVISATELIEQLRQALAARDRVIQDLAQRVQVLEQGLANLQSKTVSAQPAQGATPSISAPSASASFRSAPSQEYEQEERLAQAALDRALVARGGILLPRGMAEFEPSATYFSSSADVINIDGFSILPVLVVGDIVSQRVHRDIAISAITARVGLPKGFQVDLRFPYGYELARTVTADGQKTSQRALGIGDAELALTHQLRKGRGRGLDFLGSLRWKSKSGRDPFQRISTQPALGTGFNNVQATLTAVKPSDPVVFFGGLSYTANLPARKRLASSDAAEPTGGSKLRVKLGDTIGFNLGTALALNPETSLSFAWQQRFTRSTIIGHTVVPGSFLNEGIFQVGGSYVFAPGRSVDVSMGIGLTRDIPDFQFGLAFPVRFSLSRRPR